MKNKNQPLISSEIDAKEKLIVYVYEYLTASGAKRAAQCFLEDIQWEKEIKINPEGPGFLVNWWCVFWDLYCAAPEKRNHQIEPSNEARAFHDYNMRTVMSPSCAQTSPPQQGPPFMGAGPPPMMGGGVRYGPHSGQLRGGPPPNMGPKMQNMGPGGPPPQMVGPPPHPAHPPLMGASSPRYAPHPGHMTPGSSASSGPMGLEPGPSPGINRMTPNHSGSPHPQVGGPPNGMAGPMGGLPGPPGGPHGGPPPGQLGMGAQGGPPPPPIHQSMQQQQQQQQRGGPPQGWQGNFNVNSPAEQQCFMPGPPGMTSGQQGDFGGIMLNDGTMLDVKSSSNPNQPPNQQQQDDYVMPNAYVQQGDQGESGPEIMKLKESLEGNTKEYNDGDQTGFSMDFPESQSKW